MGKSNNKSVDKIIIATVVLILNTGTAISNKAENINSHNRLSGLNAGGAQRYLSPESDVFYHNIGHILWYEF